MNNFIELENEHLKMKVDTIFGGKIVEIIDKKKNVNWVWFDSDMHSQFRPVEFSDYDSQWIGGYEELFPNDKVETLNNKLAPDHGELWSSKWDVMNQSNLSVDLSCKGYFSNSEVIKKISIKNNKILIKYDISKINLNHYLFKLHLALPISNHKVSFKYEYFKKVDNNFGNIVKDGELNDFLSSINPSQDRNDFVYFYGVDGKVTVTNENNDSCVFNYDKTTLPYFWIFQSRGGWNNLNVNVLEPCNSGLKDLKEAVNQNMIFIPKSQNFNTWYTIEVS
tara:strand:+ start:12490 stop:13326 length:837 start_codon:yes stop_codon:yes gene_type:complete